MPSKVAGTAHNVVLICLMGTKTARRREHSNCMVGALLMQCVRITCCLTKFTHMFPRERQITKVYHLPFSNLRKLGKFDRQNVSTSTMKRGKLSNTAVIDQLDLTLV